MKNIHDMTDKQAKCQLNRDWYTYQIYTRVCPHTQLHTQNVS